MGSSFAERARATAGAMLRRTADAIDGTATSRGGRQSAPGTSGTSDTSDTSGTSGTSGTSDASGTSDSAISPAGNLAAGAGTSTGTDQAASPMSGSPSARESAHKRRKPSAPPAASLRGYQLGDLPHDIAAGAVVAALSIPIAMGYAEVVGLPAIYGLFASVIAPLAFALATGTRRIVFGMDSAVSAVTGSMLVSTGLAAAPAQVSSVIPLVTILAGVFLALFSFLGAGRLARFIPMPVMHGFVAGVSLTVIATQIPGLIGTTADMSGGFISHVIAVFGSIADANGPSTFIAAISLGLIIHLRKTMPRVPAALVVLVLTTIMCAVLRLDRDGVSVLGAIDSGFPLPAIPDLGSIDVLAVAGCALVIAVVASIESLLCLETFSMKAGIRPDGSRELLSFGVGNVAAGLFGCPPCSASLSRTAAGIASGARTQATSIAAAAIVAAVVLFLSPALYYLPRPALAAIVVVALVDVVDFEKASRYARHTMLEFGVFVVSAVVVLAYGAIIGVVAGIVASLLVALYRDRRHDQQALLGVAADDDVPGKKKLRPNVSYAVLKLEGHLSFMNIDAKIDALLDDIDDDTRAVVVKLNKVESLDTTAADKLILLVDMLHARNIHVKIVRKMRPTNDSYTRYEMRRIMRGAKFYPNMPAALAGIAKDMEREAAKAASETEAEALLASQASQTAEVGAGIGETGAGEPGSDAKAHAPTPFNSVASATQWLSANLMSHIVEKKPFEVQPDDHFVMTVHESPEQTGSGELKGKLAYIRAHEAVLFEVGFDDTPDEAAGPAHGESGSAMSTQSRSSQAKSAQAELAHAPETQQPAGTNPSKAVEKATDASARKSDGDSASPASEPGRPAAKAEQATQDAKSASSKEASTGDAAARRGKSDKQGKQGKSAKQAKQDKQDKQAKQDKQDKQAKQDKQEKSPKHPKAQKETAPSGTHDATPLGAGQTGQAKAHGAAPAQANGAPEKAPQPKRASHKKREHDAGKASSPAYKSAVLRREKTGEVLAEFQDGVWHWYFPQEILAPAVEQIDDLAEAARD